MFPSFPLATLFALYFKRLAFGTSSAENLPPATKEELLAIEKHDATVKETADRKQKEKAAQQEAKHAAEMALEQEVAKHAEQVRGKKGA